MLGTCIHLDTYTNGIYDSHDKFAIATHMMLTCILGSKIQYTCIYSFGLYMTMYMRMYLYMVKIGQ